MNAILLMILMYGGSTSLWCDDLVTDFVKYEFVGDVNSPDSLEYWKSSVAIIYQNNTSYICLVD